MDLGIETLGCSLSCLLVEAELLTASVMWGISSCVCLFVLLLHGHSVCIFCSFLCRVKRKNYVA